MQDSCSPLVGSAIEVAVLIGGRSSERGVSLSSGRCAVRALRQYGHAATPIDTADTELLQVDWNRFDACFIALHGGSGEDGTVQATLQEIGIPYTGSPPAASKIAMSKLATKGRMLENGLPVPPCVSFPSDLTASSVAARLRHLQFPLVVKPDGQGCSLGISVATQIDEIARSVARAGRFERQLLAEPFVRGREFTVALLDRRPLPVLEIIHPRSLFDYEAKFGSVEVEHRFPDENEVADVRSAAIDAAAAIGTRGLVRVDLLRDEAGQIWILELNTIPGLTERSLVPIIAEKAGIGMPQLCAELVTACIGRKVASSRPLV